MIFIVTNKATGDEVTRYASSGIWVGDWPLDAFDHTELVETPATSDTRKFGGRRILTKLEFRSLFSGTALKAIDRFEAQFEQSAFLTDDQKDGIRTSFNDYHAAADVNRDDPRWVPGLGLYVELGMMTAEEVTEVLNG